MLPAKGRKVAKICYFYLFSPGLINQAGVDTECIGVVECWKNSGAQKTHSFVEIRKLRPREWNDFPKGDTVSLERASRGKGSCTWALSASGFVWKSDSTPPLAKGPEAIQLPKGAVLIIDEHTTETRSELEKTPIIKKGNNQDIGLD